jgi:hypothetical protein
MHEIEGMGASLGNVHAGKGYIMRGREELVHGPQQKQMKKMKKITRGNL